MIFDGEWFKWMITINEFTANIVYCNSFTNIRNHNVIAHAQFVGIEQRYTFFLIHQAHFRNDDTDSQLHGSRTIIYAQYLSTDIQASTHLFQ